MGEPEKPRRTFELRIHIGADDWDTAMRALQDLADHIPAHGQACDMCSGGPDSGYWVQVIHDPEQTHERYFEQLDVYLEARRVAEAKERSDG